MKELLPGRQIVLDFGCGSGTHTVELLERGFGVLAIDVHSPGIARLAETDSPHLRLHLGDGVKLVRDHLAVHSVHEVHVMFPDPWPKARHHKRRLVQHGFLTKLRRILVPAGLLAVVSDDESYAQHVAEVLPSAPGWHVTTEEFTWEPTRYHDRALRLGNRVHSFTARTTSD